MKSEFIKLAKGNLAVEFCTIGASIYSLKYYGQEMLLTPKDKDEFISSKEYFGKSLGRVAGRIICNYDGMNLDNTHANYCLHGGYNNLSYQNFSYNIKHSHNSEIIIFEYLSKDGECGFRGNVDFKITYRIWADRLEVSYEAHSDMPTILNFSNHMYFNFGDMDLLDYNLYIPATKVLEMDENQLPISEGDLPNYLNFSKSHKISKDIASITTNFPNTIDHTYLLDQNDNQFKTGLILQNSNYKMTVKTTYEAMNCYLNCFDSNIEFTNALVKKDFKGLAVEPVHNNLSSRIKTNADETYFERTTYYFTRKIK